jgi:hypothetical protein
MGYSDNLEKLRQWKAEAKPVEAVAEQFVPGCTGKVRHPTKAGAIRAVKIVGDKSVRPYVCRRCGGWHTGHSN